MESPLRSVSPSCASSDTMRDPGEFPRLKSTIQLDGKTGSKKPKADEDRIQFFDVKFYPYTAPGVDAVFAVTGGNNIIVCRLINRKKDPIEVLNWIETEKGMNKKGENVYLNSLTWSKSQNGTPLVCVAGLKYGFIRIFNALTGELVKVLSGHGSDIDDLATSPVSPHIIASCSKDKTIRIWSLDPKDEKQPCSALLAGGHKEEIQTLAWHSQRPYLLSGGMDAVLNLWVVPDLPDMVSSSQDPIKVDYPHFTSTEFHTNMVDCVQFYGDLVISRSAESNAIMIWRITGLNSDDPPPLPADAPVPLPPGKQQTYSAFCAKDELPFQRLLSFEAPETEPFYMHFGLFHGPDTHPMLAMGNCSSKMFFWDLQRLEEGIDGLDGSAAAGAAMSRSNSSSRLKMIREGSVASNASSGVSSGAASGQKGLLSRATREKRYKIDDPFHELQAHHSITVPKISFTFRRIAWSNDGEWCVGVGGQEMVCVFKRWS